MRVRLGTEGAWRAESGRQERCARRKALDSIMLSSTSRFQSSIVDFSMASVRCDRLEGALDLGEASLAEVPRKVGFAEAS